MIPYQQLIKLEKHSNLPIYLQIANQIIHLIQSGILKPGLKLPGSRSLAKSLDLHRQTIVRALEELETQSWVEVQPSRGTFISNELPHTKARKLNAGQQPHAIPAKTAFSYYTRPYLEEPNVITQRLAFNDGSPDARLAPVNELATAYARNLRQGQDRLMMGYGNSHGSSYLRETVSAEFNKSRGLNSQAQNVMITRGSLMAVYLVANTLLRKGDVIVVGEMSYPTGNMVFQKQEAKIERISIDECGLCIDELETLCEKKKIKAIYVTSHHHHPTTVTLSPNRRLRLLQLAQQYGFAIIEDDYDYDFHYGNSPLLPLASADPNGQVIYIGSFSKATAPAFRVGYIVAPANFITELVKLRRAVDYQGDIFLENAVADLISGGILRRYLRKSLSQYRERRDLLCALLKEQMGGEVEFVVPEGGMALWARFDPKIDLIATSKAADAAGLYFSDGRFYHPPGKELNATRMGFASMNLQELEQCVAILKASLKRHGNNNYPV